MDSLIKKLRGDGRHGPKENINELPPNVGQGNVAGGSSVLNGQDGLPSQKRGQNCHLLCKKSFSQNTKLRSLSFKNLPWRPCCAVKCEEIVRFRLTRSPNSCSTPSLGISFIIADKIFSSANFSQFTHTCSTIPDWNMLWNFNFSLIAELLILLKSNT